MRRRLSILLLSAAVVSHAGAFAQPPPASTTLRVPGTIEKYEASSRVLSLSTANGKVRFPVPSAARIRRDGQTIEASELAKLSGYRVAVRYSESAGSKIVESVHVFGKE
jgi:hypothetical protein